MKKSTVPALHETRRFRWLISRNGLDLGHRFPALRAVLGHALPTNSVVDGELVALNPEGKPRFNLLQNYASSSAPVVFDLMALKGRDFRASRCPNAGGCFQKC